MDPLGLQKAIDDLSAKLNEQQDRIAQLETQIAKDVNAIADKVIAAVLPEVQGARASVDQMAVVISASVTEALNLAKRLNGATLSLGPEVQP